MTTLVVLDAKMFFGASNAENGFIWDAVNGFVLQGYRVDSVVYSSAQRHEPNPDEFTIVMSKP